VGTLQTFGILADNGRLLAPSASLITKTVGRAREGTTMAAPFSAPRTSFNGTITGHRVIGLDTLDLEEIKRIKSATGTTVNDVVLAVAGGALRSYLEDRGELPATSLLATVPVSVRESSKRESGANKVSALFARLGTDVEDPLERLQEMARANRNAKEHQQAISADALQDWAEFAAPRTFGLAVRAYAGLRLAERHPVVHHLGNDVAQRAGDHLMATAEVTVPRRAETPSERIVLGGIGFLVYRDVFENLRGERFRFQSHTKLAVTVSLLLLVGGTLGIWLLEFNNPETYLTMSTGDQLLVSYFHSASARTAGINTLVF
jgi:hypothetical protein